MKRARNILHWLEDEYLACPVYISNVQPGRLQNQRPDGTYRCCGGYGEHNDITCAEPCCYCREGFEPEARWPRRRVVGPNGYPVHSGCLEDVGWQELNELRDASS